MRVLAITYAFVPLRFPATFRLLKWCKGLTELGHDITIVAVHPDTFLGPKQASLQALVPARVHHVQVRSPENNLVYRGMRRYPGLLYRFLEPRKLEWRRAATQAIRRLDPQRYDVVFSCSQPPVCHVIGHDIARATGLPWVAFFSDPWVGNPMHADATTARIAAHNARWEERVVARADTLIFPSAELSRFMVERYGPALATKVHVLPHCFVPEWYESRGDTAPAQASVRIVCAGNFYQKRTPEPLFAALRALEIPPGGRTLHVEIYGDMAEEYQRLLRSPEIAALASFRGAVDYLESLALMRRADYLLLVDPPLGDAKESMFLPSKLIDYLGSGRPVLGLTPRAGTTARVLAETGNVSCDLDEPLALTRILRRLLDGSLHIAPQQEAIAAYAYPQVTRTLATLLTPASTGSRPRGAERWSEGASPV